MVNPLVLVYIVSSPLIWAQEFGNRHRLISDPGFALKPGGDRHPRYEIGARGWFLPWPLESHLSWSNNRPYLSVQWRSLFPQVYQLRARCRLNRETSSVIVNCLIAADPEHDLCPSIL